MSATYAGVAMTTAKLRRELATANADPFEVAALALEQVERLRAELAAARSEVEVLKVGVDCGGSGVVDFESYRKGRFFCGCGT